MKRTFEAAPAEAASASPDLEPVSKIGASDAKTSEEVISAPLFTRVHEIIEYVLPMCDAPALASAALVCKHWNANADASQLWRRLISLKTSGSDTRLYPASVR